jgi:hypothetical protein
MMVDIMVFSFPISGDTAVSGGAVESFLYRLPTIDVSLG